MGDVIFNAATFADFLDRYADFMWGMCEMEESMLAAVARGDIPAMEKGMNMSSANQKRMDAFEAERAALQAVAGCGGRTLRECVETFDEAEQKPLLAALGRFEGGLLRLRFLNHKAMTATKENLAAMDEEPPPLAAQRPGGEDKQPTTMERKV